MAENTIAIHQEWAPEFGVKVELRNGRELHVEKKEKSHNIKYIIDLLALADAGKQKTILGWKWFAAGLVAILSMALSFKLLPILNESMLYMGIVYFLGAAVSIGCFILAYKGTFRRQIFHSRNASVPLIELAINNPSKKEFCAFVSEVEEHILSSREGLNISTNNQLAGEMKMLRRLSEQGVVSSLVYNKAKTGLLSKH